VETLFAIDRRWFPSEHSEPKGAPLKFYFVVISSRSVCVFFTLAAVQTRCCLRRVHRHAAGCSIQRTGAGWSTASTSPIGESARRVRLVCRSFTRRPGLKELQFVLAVGGQLDPKQLGDVPANVMVVSYAPQIEILKRSSLCITHAGLNTVLESLSSGVPMQPGARRFHGPEQRSESAGGNPERGRSLDCRRYS
jgi:hypothetical protein